MKKKVFGVLFPLIVSVIFGFISAKLVYSVYEEDIENKLSSSKIYLLKNGEYSTYENMREENSGNNYVYYKDEEGYKTIIGITKNYDNIDKIKSLYSEDMVVDEYYVPWEYIDEKQDEYERKLYDTDDIYEVKEIVDNILNLYRSDDSIKLISIN